MKHFDPKELVQLISNITITDDKQEAAKAQTDLIVHCEDISISLLTGLTGTGKTTLSRPFAQEYWEGQKEEMTTDPSLCPVPYVLTAAPGHRGFDWKSFYKQMWMTLGDPVATSGERRIDGRQPSLVSAGEDTSEGVLRDQLQAVFLAHGTKLWIVDEAQHVLGVGVGVGKTGPENESAIKLDGSDLVDLDTL